MSGQWRTRADGAAYALDYTPLFMRMDRMSLEPDEWDELFQDVRVLESAALEQSRKPT